MHTANYVQSTSFKVRIYIDFLTSAYNLLKLLTENIGVAIEYVEKVF